MSLCQQSREWEALRYLGMKERDIQRLFAVQTGILAVLGIAVGMLIAVVFPSFLRITSYNVCYTKLLRTAVVGLLVLVVILAITQFFVQFCVHGFLYKPCGEFFHQRLNSSDIFDASFLNELSHQALFPFCHSKKPPLFLFYLTTKVYTIFSAVSPNQI